MGHYGTGHSGTLTNRLLTGEEQQPEQPKDTTPPIDDQQPSTSRATIQEFENQIKSPLECRDFPRAGPGKTNKRKKGKSMILTDTPVKHEIEERAREREQRKIKRTKMAKTVKRLKTEKVTKTLFSSPEKRFDSDDNITSCESSDNDMELPLSSFKLPKPNDFLVVKFADLKQIKFFVGQILSDIDENNEFEINYLRRTAKVDNSFYFPLEPDMAMVSAEDIELVLPHPSLSGKTKRQKSIYTFPDKILKRFDTIG